MSTPQMLMGIAAAVTPAVKVMHMDIFCVSHPVPWIKPVIFFVLFRKSSQRMAQATKNAKVSSPDQPADGGPDIRLAGEGEFVFNG